MNGEEITEDTFAEVATQVCLIREQMRAEGETPASEFEVICSVAFTYFLQEKCDIVILETGLGGRMDATNVINTPELAIITSISKDHTELLGDTLEKIATEKAGIVKENGTVLLYPQKKEVEQVFESVCHAKNADLQKAILPVGVSAYSSEGQTLSLIHI